MFLIFISLITGFIGLAIGGFILGIVGFLSPTIFLIQKIYMKLESLPEIDLPKLDISTQNSNEKETVSSHYEVCPACDTKYNENEQYCTGCGLRLMD